MARVSVIIPTYQNGSYVGQAIESVLSQTYKDFSIFVIDDGSTDITGEVLAKFLDKISIIRQTNQGPAAARNQGIKASNSEFIAFLDADDVWLPDKLERQIAMFSEDPTVALIFSNTYIFHNGKDYPKTYFNLFSPASGMVYQELFVSDFIPTLTVVIRRSCLKATGYFDEKFFGPEDYDLWLRICQHYPISFIPEPLARYRIIEGQITSNKERLIKNLILVKEKALKDNPEAGYITKKMLDSGYYNLYFRLFKIYVQERRKSEAAQTLIHYHSIRGRSFLFWLAKLIIWLPYAITNPVLDFWDSTRPFNRLLKE
jgi:glycosyltransferase involved in cell wall biosynthesis